jgi:hypothetical protein
MCSSNLKQLLYFFKVSSQGWDVAIDFSYTIMHSNLENLSKFSINFQLQKT